MPYPSKKFRQHPFTTFSVIRWTARQTDRSENITSFGGGKNLVIAYRHTGLGPGRVGSKKYTQQTALIILLTYWMI